MKHLIVISFLISVSAGYSDTVYSEDQLTVPETLEKIKEVYGNDEMEERIIQSSDFLNDISTVSTLLSHLRQTEPGDDIYIIRMVLRAVKNRKETERLIIEQLKAEKYPYQKAKLINVLTDYNSENVFNSLSDLLDDKPLGEKFSRMAGFPSRLCDMAYNAIALRLGDKNIKYPLGGELYNKRNKAISDLKLYWEKNKASVLKSYGN